MSDTLSKEIEDISDREDLEVISFGPDHFDNRFFDVVDTVYADDPNYVQPLRFEQRQLLKPTGPYLQHAQIHFFICLRKGIPIGRITAQVDQLVQVTLGEGTGQFGYFECVNDTDAVSLLFRAAEAWLASKGMTRALGPFNPTINEEVGLLLTGFDTPNVMLMPHGKPFYRQLVEGLGYTLAKTLYAYDFNCVPPLEDKFQRMVSWAERNDDIEFRFFSKDTLKDDIDLALDIFNDSWRDNWGFTPMTEGEAQRFRESLKLIMQPSLSAFAYYKGETVSFMTVLPNINSCIKSFKGRLLPFNWAKLLWWLKRKRFPHLRTPLLGTRKEHQNSRLSGILAISLIELIRRNTAAFGAQQSELSWILEDNPGINNMLTSIGGTVYKQYGIFEKPL